ncbi:MAG: PKD domain-containing protein [Acidobacteria bacterium]|nr:PKD domain-containing protein [Acidobacteriota bacterium]MCA1611440.1 PKD domain-containing protein [Acidobacteriota bacterium]
MRRVRLDGGGAVVLCLLALGAVLGLTAAVPGAAFTASTPSPAAGSLVSFADASSGNPTAWSWDFGDGGRSSERNPAHAFATAGAFTVRLTAGNASGSASATLPITVTPAGVLRLNAAHSFDITLTARDQRTGATGSGVVIGQNDVYGYFSLPTLSGNPGNPELIVKMVDASGIGQGYWVFYGTMTDLDFSLSVKENATGIVKTYAQDPAHPSGQFDTSGFTPTPAPTPTPTPPAGVQVITINTKAWEFSPGGPFAPPLVVNVGTAYRLRFHNVDPAGTTLPNHGFSGISDIGISASPGNTISPGRDYTTEVFTPQSFHRGAHPFSCTNNDCGGDPQQHTFMLGTLVVQ